MEQTTLKVLIISESGKSPNMIKTLEEIVSTLPRLVAISGKECGILEDICDDFCERAEHSINITTTSHPGETLEEVQEFVAAWDESEIGREFLTLKI